MNVLLVLLGQVTAVFAVALLGVLLAWKARAATRHLILAAAFGVTLVLPLAMLVTPTITVEVAALAASTPHPVVANPLYLQPTESIGAIPPFAEDIAAVPAALPRAPTPSMPLMSWLLIAWALVASMLSVPIVVSLWHLRMIRLSSRSWPEGTRLLDHLLRQGAPRRPLVVLNEGLAAPITCGLRRPAIVLIVGTS